MPSTWRAPLLAASLFLLVHLLDLVVLALASRHQAPFVLPRTGGLPPPRTSDDLAGILTGWDGQWYRRIAEHGYPGSLPTTSDGHVVANAWAFLPLFPALAATVMMLGLPFAVTGPSINLTSALAGVLVIHRVVSRHSGDEAATWTTIGLSLAPASAVFCLSYSEGAALLVSGLAVWSLQRRRYVTTTAYSLLLGLTRPLAPVMALTAVALGSRGDAGHRRRGLLLVTGGSIAGSLLWPACAALVTGRRDAFLATQTNWFGDGHALERSWLLAPIVGFSPPATLILDAVVVAAVAGMVLRPAAARAWPPELRLWALSTTVFILAATREAPTILRFLLLTVVPWWPVPEIARCSRRVRRVAAGLAVAAAAALNAGWIWWFARYDPGSVLLYP